MSERRTQTNEAARCAVLLPALAIIPGPLALIEVDAAAGLTLLVDYYNYNYRGDLLYGLDPDAPILSCEPTGPVPIPVRVPEVAWRAGLDLNPLDPSNPTDLEWLSCLTWPGEERRAERLRNCKNITVTKYLPLYASTHGERPCSRAVQLHCLGS